MEILNKFSLSVFRGAVKLVYFSLSYSTWLVGEIIDFSLKIVVTIMNNITFTCIAES